MTKARFDSKQPAVNYAGGYFQICVNEAEITEEMEEGEHVFYEYDFHEFYDSSITQEDVESDPEKYLEYNPITQDDVAKENPKKIAEKLNAQETQIQMLSECLLEMSEIVYA